MQSTWSSTSNLKKLTISNMKPCQISQKKWFEWPNCFTLCKIPNLFNKQTLREWTSATIFIMSFSTHYLISCWKKSCCFFNKIWLNAKMTNGTTLNCMLFAKWLLIFIERRWFEVTLPTLSISDSTKLSKIQTFTNVQCLNPPLDTLLVV